jgi:polar amino acid transport system substrate-binding protein
MTLFGCQLLAAAIALGTSAPVSAADMMGNCEMTGQKGAFHIMPAVPDQLTVEVSLPAPGWWNGDTPEAIKDGFEYCMAAIIAYRAGIPKVTVVNVAWPQLIGGNTKNYDLALSEASITEPRKKVVDFSVPYFSSDISLLVKSDTKVDSASAKDLRIGVHQGTTGADFVMTVLKPKPEVKVYTNVPAMTAALTAGQIDAVANDTAYNLAYATKSNGTLAVVGQYKTGETYGAVYPKGSPNEATFDKIIQAMKDDGTLDKLSQKYLAVAFGGDPAKVPYFTP